MMADLTSLERLTNARTMATTIRRELEVLTDFLNHDYPDLPDGLTMEIHTVHQMLSDVQVRTRDAEHVLRRLVNEARIPRPRRDPDSGEASVPTLLDIPPLCDPIRLFRRNNPDDTPIIPAE